MTDQTIQLHGQVVEMIRTIAEANVQLTSNNTATRYRFILETEMTTFS